MAKFRDILSTGDFFLPFRDKLLELDEILAVGSSFLYPQYQLPVSPVLVTSLHRGSFFRWVLFGNSFACTRI
jgi:hypothetical protein